MGRKETVPSHDCSKNWQGTSKGMEPDMALEMTHNLKDNGCPIHVLHADNDSTTTARLKVDFKELQKKDDQNHTKKGFFKKLWNEKYSTRAGTLQNMGSTQGNENFNQIVTSKAPKSRKFITSVKKSSVDP
ncbi:uncharacterized protein LOC127722351 [Mytilus californianus]|uniref:uncharacterized protein LOC127722351 n=1 Tax=Mytilus californianus TaxID=6549 RepID=UPI0022480791|nr:uncharacterized protein LOC127722351 [Mytilus californianus]